MEIKEFFTSRLKILKTSKLSRMYYTIAIFCVLLNCAIIYQTYLYNKQIKEKAIDNMKSRNMTMARVYEEYTERTLNTINQVLYDIKMDYELNPNSVNLKEYVQNHFIGLEGIINLVSISDENGDVSRFNISNAKKVNVADREYFHYHKKNPGRRMFIGNPSLGRATGKWFIPMTMRINKADGTFGGVVIISVNPYYFIDFFQRVIQGSIYLLNEKGVIIACWTDNQFNDLGKDYSETPVFKMGQYADQGIDISPSMFDQVLRIRAFRVIRDYQVTLMINNTVQNTFEEINPYLQAYNSYSAILIIVISFFSIWFFIDIRNQHKITVALKESELKANSILNTMTEGVAVLMDNKITYYNLSAMRILSATDEYLKPREFYEFFNVEDRYDIISKAKALINQEMINQRYEFQVKRMDGKKIWIHVDSSTILWQSQPALLVCFNDISQQKEWAEREHQQMIRIESINYHLENEIHERKVLETERISMINTLNQKNEELERFVYTVSHDLRSPLITIKGFSGFLKQDVANNNHERALKDIERIEFSAEKMSQLIDDLLEVSRAGRVMRAFTTVNIEKTIQDVLNIMQIHISNHKGQIVTDTPLPEVYGDIQKIRQLYQNLIENAIKYAKKDEIPQIHLGYDQQKGAFYVSDNGIGIPEEYKDKIFDVFKKVSGESKGSGIGLSIVKRITEIHHGHIWIESKPEIGTTFFFTLDTNIPDQKEPEV